MSSGQSYWVVEMDGQYVHLDSYALEIQWHAVTGIEYATQFHREVDATPIADAVGGLAVEHQEEPSHGVRPSEPFAQPDAGGSLRQVNDEAEARQLGADCGRNMAAKLMGQRP